MQAQTCMSGPLVPQDKMGNAGIDRKGAGLNRNIQAQTKKERKKNHEVMVERATAAQASMELEPQWHGARSSWTLYRFVPGHKYLEAPPQI